MVQVSPRNAIIARRDEANSCIRHGLYTSATLTACSGVELLLESLFTEYYISMLRDDREGAARFLAERDEWNAEHDLKNQWTITIWRRYFEDKEIPSKMTTQFGQEIRILSSSTLRFVNEEWNRCKHDVHLASMSSAENIVALLNRSLEELEFLSSEKSAEQTSAFELSTQWSHHWGNLIQNWVAENRSSHVSTILSQLTQLLNLVIGLAHDPRLIFELKTSLLVAAHYVFSKIDLIPEKHDDVEALVDDAAVLVLTLVWLMDQDQFDNTLLNDHWPEKGDVNTEIGELNNYINEYQHNLFPKRVGATSGHIVWATLRRVASDGPEALWQNYWKEAY